MVGTLFDVTLLPTVALPSDDCLVELCNARFVDRKMNEIRMANVSTGFSIGVTGLYDIVEDVAIKGGDALYITSAIKKTVTVYSFDGRAVASCVVSPGVTRVALQSGVYVVCGQKVLIR